MEYASRIAYRMKRPLPASVRFVSLMDAGFVIDYPAYDLTTHKESTASPTTREQELSTTATVWSARGDASCEAAATDALSKMMCRSAENVIGGGYISSPLFVRQSQSSGAASSPMLSPLRAAPHIRPR